MSVTVDAFVGDVLPASSVSFAVTLSPLFSVVPSGTGTVQFPSSSTFTVSVVPSGNVTVTVSPGVPVPVTSVEPASTGLIGGASGAVVSVTFAVVSVDVLPALSVSFAVTLSPLFNVVPSGTSTVQFPSLSTVPVPVVPSGNVTVTVLPGSPVPVTSVEPDSIGLIGGADGAFVSSTVVVPTGDVFG